MESSAWLKAFRTVNEKFLQNVCILSIFSLHTFPELKMCEYLVRILVYYRFFVVFLQITTTEEYQMGRQDTIPGGSPIGKVVEQVFHSFTYQCQ